MPAWGPISRRDLLRALRRLGFDGPFSGGRHQFMVHGDKDIGIDLLGRVLRQAGVNRKEWAET